MRKILILLATVLVLGACRNETPKEEVPKKEPVAVENEENEVIDVKLSVEPIFDYGKVHFVGETNLPDRGVLMFTVTGPNDFMAQTKEIVLDGEFQTDVFGAKGEPLQTGVYDLSISLSIPSTQEADFLRVAGQNYEYLIGDLMDDDGNGKTMEYETIFVFD